MSDGQPLSPRAVKQAQKRFYLFSLLNVVSFQLLTGNIITLYALRLGAGAFLIGLLYSFIPMAQILPFAGRMIVRKFGTIRTMGFFWYLRYGLMVPILFAPLFATPERQGVGIVLIVISVVGFNLARGIGITGHNSVIGAITTESERGAFLSRNQIIVHAGSILIGVVMALALGNDPPLYIYSILLLSGIASGLVAARVVFTLPEPPVAARSGAERFLSSFKTAFSRHGFTRFIVFLVINSFLVSMITPFLVVFLKKVYGFGDDRVIFLTVIGSFGAIVMALISGFMIDRLGAKPLIAIFAGIVTISTAAFGIAPNIQAQTGVFIYAGIIFFFMTMGSSGIGNAANIYFFGAIKPEERLNLGILYFVSSGAAATLGSLAGGMALEWLQADLGLQPVDSFRAYFLALVGALMIMGFLIVSLAPLGAYAIRDVLNIFISPRDLRALSLLHRLKTTQSATDEQAIVRALGQTRSGISIVELLQELQSPRFMVRAEAISALERIRPNSEVRQALIAEVENQPFTTAHLAADVLGKKGIAEARDSLRRALKSDDVFLAGKSMVALARLGDQQSIPTVEEIFRTTDNPRLLIHGATALEILHSRGSVRVLLEKLRAEPSSFVRDEIILAVAGLLGMGSLFHHLYARFLKDPADGIVYLKDFVDEQMAGGRTPSIPAESLQQMVDLTSADDSSEALAERLRDLLPTAIPAAEAKDLRDALLESTQDERLRHIQAYRFLLSAAVVSYAFGEPAVSLQ